jgi:flagellar basal-body rod protein FlgB
MFPVAYASGSEIHNSCEVRHILSIPSAGIVDTFVMTITTGKIELLTRLLDVAAMRQDVIAQNVANVNTPGYAIMEVNFEDTLREALSSSDWRERLSGVTAEVAPSAKAAERSDGNNVDVDLEMGRLQKNGLCFQAYTQMLANELSQFRAAISGQ